MLVTLFGETFANEDIDNNSRYKLSRIKDILWETRGFNDTEKLTKVCSNIYWINFRELKK